MRILVTGSNGTIGKPLVALLKKKGYKVREFDLANGHNLLNYREVREAMEDCDVVIHAAAILDENHPRLLETNIVGTENVLNACADAGVKRAIYLSSVAVYGVNQDGATEETPFAPQTHYEKSKAEAEELANVYFSQLDLTILRPAIVLGPNVYWERIFNLVKKDFPLIGSGDNHWQIVHRDDLVDSIIFCLGHKKTCNEIYNVAEADSYTLKELVMNIRLMLGISPRVKTVPVWFGFTIAGFNNVVSKFTGKSEIVTPAYVERLIRSRKYSIEKIKNVGWNPKYDMKHALKHTFEEFEKQGKFKQEKHVLKRRQE